eukprot:8006645-Karenia_brevis.AAC.1
MRWVDMNNAWKPGDLEVRRGMVARGFKGGDKERDDLFAETPPLEATRSLISRAASLPEACNGPPGMCAKLVYWMYGMRQAASAWE